MHYLTFQSPSHECISNVTSGDCKDQNRKCLPFEEFDKPVQEYNINRYDYKNRIISEANSYYLRKSAPP